MKYWNEFDGYFGNLKKSKREKIDNSIYSFDIETTSYLILNNKQIPACKYLELTKEEQENCEFRSNMYIWQFSINDDVYYGRTWEHLKSFLLKLYNTNPYKKIVYIHNLSFEFEYLQSEFNLTNVFARKKRKVMKCDLEEYNIEFRCSYFLSNCKLELLPKIYKLPVEKQVGSLNYDLIRHSRTYLSKEELKYCEYDCLVVYEYIKKELETYKRIDKIPLTSTGHVRRELKSKVYRDFKYSDKVKKAINTNPHIFNMLTNAFQGGYTHANWIYTDEIIKDVDSFDFTSSYPYILVSHRFPATTFRKCNITNVNQMCSNFAYLLKVKFYKIKSKYYNNFISVSKCESVKNCNMDNGRIMSADEIEITITDVDFYFYLETYSFEKYEIIESYYSRYDYLPKQFIEFVLEKYVNKTKYKGVKDKEIEYAKEKNKFNSLYGMSVTNMIRDEVQFVNNEWTEVPLTNEEIKEKLFDEKKKAFLSFAYGVWVTAHARSNLLKNLVALDEFVIYSDTDSLKLRKGYNKEIIENYNKFVENKIKYVSKKFNIDIEKFSPKDNKGKNHMLGLFELDEHYDEFITQGAKKYAYKQNGEIHITVAGVPKSRFKGSKRLKRF